MDTNDPSSPAGGSLELAPGVHAAEKDLLFQFSRSSGPGGQNVNKVNTKAELWVAVRSLAGLAPDAVDRLRAMAGRRLTAADEVHIVAETERTQEGNRSAVLDRLRELLIQAMHRPKTRRRTKPSRAARRRRLESKRRRSEVKSHRRAGGRED